MKKRHRERIYIIFGWGGLALGALILAIFIVGSLPETASPLARGLGIVLVVAAVVVLIQSNENLRGISIVRASAPPVPAGEPRRLETVLQNSSRGEKTGIHVAVTERWRTRLPEWIPVLTPGGSSTATITLPTKPRGVYPLPKLRIFSLMPTGLYYAWKTFEPEGRSIVYPRPVGLPLTEAPGASGTAAGQHGRGGEDVSGHRPHMAGDSLSRIDWKIFAKRGDVVVRNLEDGSGIPAVLRWSDTAFLSDPEDRLCQLSRWIADCVADSQPFTLEIGTRLLDGRDLTACYEALATFAES